MDYIRYKQAERDIGRKYEAAGREEGLIEGRREGRREGCIEGESRMARLAAALFKAGRGNEISEAALDKAYREKLYAEFGV